MGLEDNLRVLYGQKNCSDVKNIPLVCKKKNPSSLTISVTIYPFSSLICLPSGLLSMFAEDLGCGYSLPD